MRNAILKCTVLLGVLLLMAVVIVGKPAPAIADVNVGDSIDSSNWQKVQGLVPEFMTDYLKKGWIKMKIGKLNYDPADAWNLEYKESLTKNLGKYGINAKCEMFDKKTGEIDPGNVVGMPFPDLDTKDPQVGLMMLQNHMTLLSTRGNTKSSATLHFVGKKMERLISGPQLSLVLRGTSKNVAQQSQVKSFGDKVDSLFIMKVTDPYELNGLATMTYQYYDNTADKVFAYVPALRRTRVLTAAARSDAMFGTDLSLDDSSGGFMGKPRDFNCKFLRTQEALVRFTLPDIVEVLKYPNGTYETKSHPDFVYGFQTPGWTGKGWATTNDFYVKRKVHVIECTAKDPYYGYGKFELWYEPVATQFAYKTIWDRAGKRWKCQHAGIGGYASKDRLFGKMESGWGDWIYDEQRDHATTVDSLSSKQRAIYHDPSVSPSDFTMNGFTKYAK